MSRGQENQVVSEAQGQNSTAATNAQQSYNQAQSDIGNYQNQLSQFAAANPYGVGGAYQTSQNQVLSNTADAAAQAAGQAMQSQAVRTGQNAGGAIAATEATEQGNERNLASQEAQANQNRISSGAQYGNQVLNASEVPATLEAGLTGQQLNAEQGALSNQEKAAATPSTADTVFGDVLSAASDAAKIAKPCWIAARLFGGWLDPRTARVRLWLTYSFGTTRRGKLLLRLYQRYGERVADVWMPRSPLLTGILSRVFAAALRRAEEWTLTAEGMRVFDEYVNLLQWRSEIAPVTNKKAVADWAIALAGKVR